jgi:hypothetical protein
VAVAVVNAEDTVTVKAPAIAVLTSTSTRHPALFPVQPKISDVVVGVMIDATKRPLSTFPADIELQKVIRGRCPAVDTASAKIDRQF